MYIYFTLYSVSDQNNPHDLKIGSVVEYLGNYGEIKWIGNLAEDESLMAGLEMVILITHPHMHTRAQTIIP